jgi:4-hydroxy-tetrahydrodipicolinate reductase
MMGGTFFYASNYSIGMNIFFRVNEQLAKIMNGFPAYNVSISETHHIQKKDAPSGTAITIAEGIIDSLNRKSSWVNSPTPRPEILEIESIREGTVAGIHEVEYESEADTIKIEHTSKSRIGLAIGAVLAAEFTQGRTGVLSMQELIKLTMDN